MLLEWPMLAFYVMKFVSLCSFLLYICCCCCCCCCCFFWFHRLWLVWAWLWNRFFHYSLQWELVSAYLALQWCAILLSTQMSGLAIPSWSASCSSVWNYVRISCFPWDLKICLYPPSPRVLCLESLLTFTVTAKHQRQDVHHKWRIWLYPQCTHIDYLFFLMVVGPLILQSFKGQHQISM